MLPKKTLTLVGSSNGGEAVVVAVMVVQFSQFMPYVPWIPESTATFIITILFL